MLYLKTYETTETWRKRGLIFQWKNFDDFFVRVLVSTESCKFQTKKFISVFNFWHYSFAVKTAKIVIIKEFVKLSLK